MPLLFTIGSYINTRKGFDVVGICLKGTFGQGELFIVIRIAAGSSLGFHTAELGTIIALSTLLAHTAGSHSVLCCKC